VTHRVYVMTFLSVLVLAALAQAQKFGTLYNFTGGTDGGGIYAGVIQDSSGNLYGTAADGGDLNCPNPNGCGVVFKVNTAGTETVLYTFCSQANCVDGKSPYTSVVRDKAGSIYGTTGAGGSTDYGTVFKIDTSGNETVLHSFAEGSADGCDPMQGLLMDKAGNLYGTASGCGHYRYYGTIFKVDSAGNFTVLHSFTGGSSDGASPFYGHLTTDKFGNLYGVTYGGGAYGYGVLYELSKKGTLTVLHSFTGGTSDGCHPYGSVAQDNGGNLYGTTYQCGSNNYGTIWKVSKKGKETILHNFAGGASDGCNPYAGVARDSKGNLYGVTYGCGAKDDGVLYELSASGKLTLLWTFDASYYGGSAPRGEALLTTKGTLFGTAEQGGTYGWGTVWKYVP